MLANTVPRPDVVPYIISELLGGVVGYYIYAITSKNPMVANTMNTINGGKKK